MLRTGIRIGITAKVVLTVVAAAMVAGLITMAIGLRESDQFAARASEQTAAELDALHETPADDALATSLGVNETVLDPTSRWIEVSNWLEFQVLGRAR